jgi:hypothetical protein
MPTPRPGPTQPPCDPSCLTFSGRVQRSSDEVQTFECGQLARLEVAARFHRAPVGALIDSIAVVERMTRRISAS